MPKDTTSPFTPGRPVPVEFFVGRTPEIEQLKRKVRDAIQAQRIEIAFVSGERGIGKSSLASFVRRLCEKELSVLGIHAMMGGETTVEGVVRRIFDQLLKESSKDSGLLGRIKDLFGKYVREAGLFGITVEFSPDAKELRTIASKFDVALKSVLDRVRDDRQGMLIIIDDLNGLAESAEFANWFKSFVDEVSVARVGLPICVMLVGLEERRRSLVERQPSLARVFDVVNIRSWSDHESRSFFRQSFSNAEVEVEPKAVDIMARYAGGLPVLAHEIGDATFQIDLDAVVDEPDAYAGIVAAADVVGRKYVDPVVYKSLRSENYRQILKKLVGEFENERFTRSAVQKKLTNKETGVLDNFLRKMKKLGVLVEDTEGGRGSYRFGTRLSYLYFFMRAQDNA